VTAAKLCRCRVVETVCVEQHLEGWDVVERQGCRSAVWRANLGVREQEVLAVAYGESAGRLGGGGSEVVQEGTTDRAAG